MHLDGARSAPYRTLWLNISRRRRITLSSIHQKRTVLHLRTISFLLSQPGNFTTQSIRKSIAKFRHSVDKGHDRFDMIPLFGGQQDTGYADAL